MDEKTKNWCLIKYSLEEKKEKYRYESKNEVDFLFG